LYLCDASVFPYCTDKTTTLSIMAFTMRTCEHLVAKFKSGEHKLA
jgi:choline dehydrogenase-like flavoprotein